MVKSEFKINKVKIQMHLIKNICKTIYGHLGKGYSESVYQHGLSAALTLNGIKNVKELTIPVMLYGTQIGTMRADIVLPDHRIVIECKANKRDLDLNNLPQIIKYLKALEYNRGLVVNFNQHAGSDDDLQFITLERIASEYKIDFSSVAGRA